jgi:catechol 2,3-dioxygenase-like lactoylglutathione lyase family enzyme
VHLGHARVRVRNLDRAIDFYVRVLGLHLTERVGDTFAFLSCDRRTTRSRFRRCREANVRQAGLRLG